MTDIAARNRQIKKTLEQAFGRGKVRVRGSRGTGYGYVSVHVDWTPLDVDARRAMEAQCFALLRAAKIDLGSRYTDDTCQYTCTECSISFNTARYFRAQKHSDGSMSVLTDQYNGKWQHVGAPTPWTPETARQRVGGSFGT